MATETKTFYPGEYDGSSNAKITNATNPVGKGSGNTTYAAIAGQYKSSSPTVFWPFDVSSIPEDATIDSVSCKAKVASSSGPNDWSSATLQLYSGATAKGTATSFNREYSATVYTLNTGAWTREELSGIRLRIYAKWYSGSSNPALSFYGADLTVTYTYQSEKFMLKLGGAWHDIARVFKKVNGIWVEQTDLANVIEDGVRYQNGGEIESTAPKPISVTITGTGHGSRCFATINGTTYAGAASNIEVYPGDSITFGVYSSSQSSSTAGVVSIDGTNVVSVNGGFKSYQWVVPNGVDTISVAFAYYNGLNVYGTITVTTTGSGSSTNLISFTIDGTSYQAQEGMTWEQWVASSYNTGGFKVVSNYGNYYPATSTGVYLKNPEGYIALSTAVIISGGAYTALN